MKEQPLYSIEDPKTREKQDSGQNEYEIFGAGEVDVELMKQCLHAHGLKESGAVSMLPYGSNNRVGFETRRLYFALATNEDGTFSTETRLRGDSLEDHKNLLPVTRIISFGDCNVACPYCKRDCQFVGDDGKPIVAKKIRMKDYFSMADGAQTRNEIVRFSGGDPVMFTKETLALAEYMDKRYGAKVSIAHNGSGPEWVKKMIPYLSSAAIDLKAVPEKIGKVMGVSQSVGERLFQKTLETQKIISDAGTVQLDVRTPLFGDTTQEEMERLADHIGTLDPKVTFWTWRMYKPVDGCDWPKPEKESVIKMMEVISTRIPKHWIGMRAKWEKGGMIYFHNGKMVNHKESQDVTDAEADGSGNKLEVSGRAA